MSFVTGRRIMSEEEALADLKGTVERHTAEDRRVVEEYAAKWTAEKRKQAEKNGDAMPGGKYPIVDQQDMNAAARLMGSGDVSSDAIEEHMKRMAKKHGLKLPMSIAGS